jgi:hypothetical protein
VIVCAPPSNDFFSPAIVGAAIAFVATLTGVGATEFASYKRTRRAQELDWNRRLFDRYADAYRDFLATWGGAANPELLESTFLELRSKALIPASLSREFESVLEGMQGTSDLGVRRENAQRLQVKIDQMLGDPVGLSKG